MHYEKISVFAKGEQADVYAYILDRSEANHGGSKRPLVLICPGGGYEHVSDREGEPIALTFNAAGFHSVVLDYSVAPAKWPVALLQLAQTIELIRNYAEDWNVDPDKIILAGFSAGGHLAASLGVLWNKGFIEQNLGCKGECYEPNGMILSYPVISSTVNEHQDSIQNLFGNDKELTAKYSLETLVDEKTPPTFLWHTYEDDTVPVENSLMFASALRKHGVGCELHIYQYGGHGLSLATPEVNVNDAYANVPGWIQLAIEWLKRL